MKLSQLLVDDYDGGVYFVPRQSRAAPASQFAAGCEARQDGEMSC